MMKIQYASTLISCASVSPKWNQIKKKILDLEEPMRA